MTIASWQFSVLDALGRIVGTHTNGHGETHHGANGLEPVSFRVPRFDGGEHFLNVFQA